MAVMLIRSMIVAGMLAVLSVPAYSFDGKRKGFFMELAAGPGVTAFRQNSTYVTQFTFIRDGALVDSLVITRSDERQTRMGVSTNFVLGFGLNERVAVSYQNRVAWFGTNQHVTVASGVTGLAVAYYLSSSAPTAYFTGGIGLGSYYLLEKSSRSNSGLGLIAGGGYEFRKHWAIEAEISDARTSEIQGSRKTAALSGHLTIAWKGY